MSRRRAAPGYGAGEPKVVPERVCNRLRGTLFCQTEFGKGFGWGYPRMIPGGSLGTGSSAYPIWRLWPRSGSMFPFPWASNPVRQLGEGLGTATGVLEFRGTGRAVAQLKVSTPVLAISLLDVRGRKPSSTVTPASGTAAERVLIAPGEPVLSDYSLLSDTRGFSRITHPQASFPSTPQRLKCFSPLVSWQRQLIWCPRA